MKLSQSFKWQWSPPGSTLHRGTHLVLCLFPLPPLPDPPLHHQVSPDSSLLPGHLSLFHQSDHTWIPFCFIICGCSMFSCSLPDCWAFTSRCHSDSLCIESSCYPAVPSTNPPAGLSPAECTGTPPRCHIMGAVLIKVGWISHIVLFSLFMWLLSKSSWKDCERNVPWHPRHQILSRTSTKTGLFCPSEPAGVSEGWCHKAGRRSDTEDEKTILSVSLSLTDKLTNVGFTLDHSRPRSSHVKERSSLMTSCSQKVIFSKARQSCILIKADTIISNSMIETLSALEEML